MGTKCEREKFLSDISRNGELRDLPSRREGSRNKEKIYERDNIIPITKSKKYTSKSGKLSKKRRKAKLRKTFRALLAAGLVTISTYGANEYYIKPVTLQEALDAGESLENLGLNEETLSGLEQIQSSLLIKDELSKEEIKELGTNLENMELDLVKEKIGNALGTDSSITTTPRNGDSLESTISFYDEKSDKDKILVENKDYDSEIGSYIERIASLQIANDAYAHGGNSREDILKIYEKCLKETVRFASSKITVNENGKIKFDKTTKADLEKIKENENKKLASIEDEGR